MEDGKSKKPSINEILKNIETTEIEKIKSTLANLYSVWNEIGMEEDQMQSRIDTTFGHIHSLVNDIYDEESSLREELKGKYTTLSGEIARLTENLAIQATEIPEVPLIRRVNLLQREFDTLKKLREKRIQELKDLRLFEEKYCLLLGVEKYQFSSEAEIPSITDLNQLQSHVETLSQEYILRNDKYIHSQKEILSILDEVEITPETSFEEHIFSGKSPDSLSEETLVSIGEILEKVKKRKIEFENLKSILILKLKALWERLNIDNQEFLSNYPDLKVASLKCLQQEIEKCEEIKKKNLEPFITVLREELKDLWDKCGISDSEKQSFSNYLNAEANEDTLTAHEEELDKWKKYCVKIKPIVEKIHKRNDLWELLKSFDGKARDPERLKNRGGNLLKEEKERNRLLKALPTLENQIFQDIENYEKETGNEFIYKEENYKLLIAKQWQERSNQNENLELDRPLSPTSHAARRLSIERAPSAKTSRSSIKGNPSSRSSIYQTPIVKARATPKTPKKTVKKIAKKDC